MITFIYVLLPELIKDVIFSILIKDNNYMNELKYKSLIS